MVVARGRCAVVRPACAGGRGGACAHAQSCAHIGGRRLAARRRGGGRRGRPWGRRRLGGLAVRALVASVRRDVRSPRACTVARRRGCAARVVAVRVRVRRRRRRCAHSRPCGTSSFSRSACGGTVSGGDGRSGGSVEGAVRVGVLRCCGGGDGSNGGCRCGGCVSGAGVGVCVRGVPIEASLCPMCAHCAAINKSRNSTMIPSVSALRSGCAARMATSSFTRGNSAANAAGSSFAMRCSRQRRE